MSYKDVRDFLDYLRKKDELKTCSREVDTRIEIAKVTDKSSKTNGPAILFTNVKGFQASVVTGLFGTIDRGFSMIESNKYDGYKKIANGLDNLISPKIVNDGPCKEIIKIGQNINLHEIPVLLHHEKDGNYFITTANCRVKDPDTGISNTSINRIAVQGKDRLSIQSNAPHQLAVIAAKYLARGKSCPIAMAIGLDPALLVAGACGIPPGIDEYEFAGGMRGAPVELVKCSTIEIEVPAASELVIEGEIVPGTEDGPMGKTEYADEGSFGEVSGYFGAHASSPVIQVKAITHRKDYIYHGFGTAEPPSEHQIFDGIGMQADVYVALKSVIPKELIGSIYTISWSAVISIKKNRPGQARDIINTLLKKAGLKRVTIVDDDIDAFNPVEVDWAVQFRSGPDDYIFTTELPAIELDPMITTPPNLLKKIGIDATIPLDGDKKGRIEILRDQGTARYSSLDKVNLANYI